jgi:hypothetical protein
MFKIKARTLIINLHNIIIEYLYLSVQAGTRSIYIVHRSSYFIHAWYVYDILLY